MHKSRACTCIFRDSKVSQAVGISLSVEPIKLLEREKKTMISKICLLWVKIEVLFFSCHMVFDDE